MHTRPHPHRTTSSGTQRRRAANTTQPAGPPPALKNFDDLPDSSHVRAPIVAAVLGCSIGTVWRLAKAGKLKPRRLSARCTCFNVGELRAYMRGEQGGAA